MSQIPANYCADNVLAPLFPEHMGIGMNIRRARKHAGLTVQQSDVSKWETDTALPELLSLVKVATVLRISINSLLVGMAPTYDAIVRDLPSHAGTVDSPGRTIGGSPGVIHNDQSARIHALEDQITTYKAIIDRAHAIGVQLVTATGITLPRESAPTRGTQPRRRRHS